MNTKALRDILYALGEIRRIAMKMWAIRLMAFITVVSLFYLMFMNYTGPTRVGIARNYVTGTMWLQERGGWFITAPWVLVARVDTRPMRVAVVSAGRGYSGKLVQFEPRAWQEFVAIEGFHYYWWYNRISINFGYDEEYRGMRDIMRGHAFGTKRYSFIKVLNEYQVQ